MTFRTLAQRPTLFLAGLLLAATVSACSSAATASSTGTVATAAPAATQVTAAQDTAAAPNAAQPAAAAPTAAPAASAMTAAPATAAAATATPGANPSTTQAAASGAAKINLNTATAEQILTVPNAGNRMVREFQEYRPYTSILTFRQEIGKYVDAATVAGYEQYVYVPVDPNQSDEATLQQIPGLTADLAKALIAARPYASNDAFLAKLAESLTADQVTAAKAYLQ